MSGLICLAATWNSWISYKNGYAGLLLVLQLLPLLNHWLIVCQNVASLSFFCRYYFGRFSSESAEWVELAYSQGRSTRFSDRFQDFFVTIPRFYKDVYVNSFFPCIARLWNSFPIKCFPLTYDLSDFKSIINRHFLIVGSF